MDEALSAQRILSLNGTLLNNFMIGVQLADKVIPSKVENPEKISTKRKASDEDKIFKSQSKQKKLCTKIMEYFFDISY